MFFEIFYKNNKKICAQRIANKIWLYAEKKFTKYKITESKYVKELCGWVHCMKNKFPKRCFETITFLPFEEIEIPVPGDYITYLNILYPHYTEIPPENERTTNHNAIVIDPDHSCEMYRGFYYCVESERSN